MRSSRWFVADVLALVFATIASGMASGAAMAADKGAAPAEKGTTPAEKGVDPEAARMLKQMAAYLASLQTFTVRTAVTDETVMKSGEKLQTMSNAEVSVQRPNRLRSLQRGSDAGLGLWYDGKSMTVACKASNTFQTVSAPPTLDLAIDKMRKTFNLDAPGADLLYSHPYDILTEQVVSGRFVGRETIDGKPANHLAFKGEEVDIQLWIQDGAQPLPLRYVIVTKTVQEHPEFAVELSDWNTQPQLPASTFAFRALPEAKSARAIVSSCGGSPSTPQL